MEEMTEEEKLDTEIAEKMKSLTPRQRELLEELDSWNVIDNEAYIDSQLKEAKHKLWEKLQDTEFMERLVKYLKDHTPCSLCSSRPVMLTRVIEGDRLFICESCIIKNQKVDIVKVYNSDHTISWEWKND